MMIIIIIIIFKTPHLHFSKKILKSNAKDLSLEMQTLGTGQAHSDKVIPSVR